MNRALAAALGLCAGCALPVVSANTFVPAGDLKRGDLYASVSLDVGRVLAGPSDVHDLPKTPPEAQKWEVSTWVASDVSLRWQALSRLTLEAQVKLTDSVVPLTPSLTGGSLGARFRVLERPSEGGFSLEMGARAVGVSTSQHLQRLDSDGHPHDDDWNYRAWGVEAPLVGTYRVNPLFAVTLSPFLRAYWIRAWHTTTVGLTPQSEAALQWAPVLSGGLGGAAAFDLGFLELSPSAAVELVTRPGPGAVTHFIFEPGLMVGTRF